MYGSLAVSFDTIKAACFTGVFSDAIGLEMISREGIQ